MQPCRFKPLRIDDSLDEKQAKFRRDKICQGDYPESRFKFCGTEPQLVGQSLGGLRSKSAK